MSINTNKISSTIMVLALWGLLLTKSVLAEGESTEAEDAHAHADDESEHGHPAHGVLYPSFVLTLGVVVYYVLSRFLHWLPYTAIMFLLGVIMGLVTATEVVHSPDLPFMHNALDAWQSIDSEVLLLVFLPGLVFKDAQAQNPYLFAMAFGQLFIFAFPNVLAGTCLTALVGRYILPYDWPFFLCLTFGAIMSATDPVAVSALLEEVGAPPRLTTHIAGESLLNDGAAIVFFFIFKDIFLSEIGVEGLGSQVDVAGGVTMFVQKAFGGFAIGLVAGGTIILVLKKLSHRFSKEENIVQVTAVLGLVYLSYFVAEVVCETSGVIATLAAGLCVKFFGRGFINNIHLMDDFNSILEHILNTILFSLGGLVWGFTVYENHRMGFQDGKDWGYLFLLYVLLHVIRAILFIAVYPITSRIGLKTNWKETTFQIYGGLRGAVGIALAIFLDNELHGLSGIEKYQEDVAQVYFMVGGMAFLTLFINGATAGPFLKKLGLADSTEVRKNIVEAELCKLRSTMIDTCVHLLTHQRFKSVDFSFVQEHIHLLEDLTVEQLVEAVKKMKETTERNAYKPPYLKNILEVLGDAKALTAEDKELLDESPEKYARLRRSERRRMHKMSSLANMMKDHEPLSTKEMRLLFISILRSQYEHLIDEGIIGSQEGQTVALLQSLELAKSEVNRGGRLNDLEHMQTFCQMTTKFSKVADKIFALLLCGRQPCNDFYLDYLTRLQFAFTNAHERAQKVFQEQLGDFDRDLSEGGKVVLDESFKQVEKVRRHFDRDSLCDIVTMVSTRRFCNIILTRGIAHVEELVDFGLLKESEAEEIIEDLVHIQKKIRKSQAKVSHEKCEHREMARNLSQNLLMSTIEEGK